MSAPRRKLNTQVQTVSLWARYLLLLDRRPFVTKAVTSGVLKFFATLASQIIKGVEEVDWMQVKQYVFFAVFLDLPVSEPWYSHGLSLLSHALGLHAIQKSQPQLAKLIEAVVDQFTFGIFHTAYFFVTTGLIEGHGLYRSWRIMLDRLLPTTRDSLVFWIPTGYLTLNLRPSLQILGFQAWGTIWAGWLAYRQKAYQDRRKIEDKKSL